MYGVSGEIKAFPFQLLEYPNRIQIIKICNFKTVGEGLMCQQEVLSIGTTRKSFRKELKRFTPYTKTNSKSAKDRI